MFQRRHPAGAPARPGFRRLAGCVGVFMLVGAIVFLFFGLTGGPWHALVLAATCLFNAGLFLGIALTGRPWGVRPRRST